MFCTAPNLQTLPPKGSGHCLDLFLITFVAVQSMRMVPRHLIKTSFIKRVPSVICLLDCDIIPSCTCP